MSFSKSFGKKTVSDDYELDLLEQGYPHRVEKVESSKVTAPGLALIDPVKVGRQQAEISVVKKMYQTVFMHHIEGGLAALVNSTPQFVELANSYTAITQQKANAKAEADELKWRECPYILVTINPPEDIDIDTLYDCVCQIKSKTWIGNDYVYCFEQRGVTDEELGKGIHAHMLLYRGDKPKSEVVREIKSTVKKYGLYDGKDPTDRQLNFKPIRSGTESRVVNYMLGNKDDVKSAKVAIDVKWREQNNLAPIYDPEVEELIDQENAKVEA